MTSAPRQALRRSSLWMRELLRDKVRRAIAFTVMSIPANLLFAAWKVVLAVQECSVFILAAAAFNIGLAVIKFVLVRAHIRVLAVPAHRGITIDPGLAALRAQREYRFTGLLIILLSIGFVVGSLPLTFAVERFGTLSTWSSIQIAALSFVEFGLAVHGMVSARRNRTPLVEAVKWANLAGSLVLLALAQTALMTSEHSSPNERYFGGSGVVFGLAAAACGFGMVVRVARGRLYVDRSSQVDPIT